MTSADAEPAGSGGFRLDRAVALEKLMRFQLPEPGLYALALARCAAAGEATRVFFSGRDEGRALAVRFDGKPFSADELRDPFACLFDPRQAQGPRGRELATALLALLRLAPARITLRSGRGSRRVRLRLDGLDRLALSAAPGTEDESVLEAEQQSGAAEPLWGPRARELLARSCGLCEAAIYADGRRVPAFDPDAEPGWVAVYEEGTRGFLRLPVKPRERGELTLYCRGVLVCRVEHRFATIQAEGLLNDDRLRLNASQTGVLGDARLRAALAAAERAAASLGTPSSRAQPARKRPVSAQPHAWGDARGDAEQADPVARVRRLLRRLGRAGACPVPERAVAELETARLPGCALAGSPQAPLSGWRVWVGEDEPPAPPGWALNLAHPLAAAVETESGLPPAVRAAYLVSLFATAANRALPELTDEQDARLCLALAEALSDELDA